MLPFVSEQTITSFFDGTLFGPDSGPLDGRKDIQPDDDNIVIVKTTTIATKKKVGLSSLSRKKTPSKVSRSQSAKSLPKRTDYFTGTSKKDKKKAADQLETGSSAYDIAQAEAEVRENQVLYQNFA